MLKKLPFLLLCLYLPLLGGHEALKSLSPSIVRVACTSNYYNYDSPWQPPFQSDGSGSASLIEGPYILTNAHVVAGGVNLYLKREDKVHLFPARILAIQHDMDLALLQVEDPKFFEGLTPLPLGEMPKPQDEIYTLGYPTGGERLSITKGVISRTEMQASAHSGITSIFTQIDAPINPGNSGGAVIKEGKLVGVPTQGKNYGQNIGYMVPVDSVKRFLRAYTQKRNSKVPSLDISVQDFRNADLREFVGLSEDRGGVIVTGVKDESVAKGILQEMDVVLSINGHKIESDGTYLWRPGEHLSALNIVRSQLIGDSLHLEVYRKGKVEKKEIVMSKSINDTRLVDYKDFDNPPRYFLWGSLVFQPLDENYLSIWGEEWLSQAPIPLVDQYLEGEKSEGVEELVMLSRILPHDSNLGYHNIPRGQVLKKVNGEKISSLEALFHYLNSYEGEFLHFELAADKLMTLKAQTLKQSHPDVMQIYGIQQDKNLSK